MFTNYIHTFYIQKIYTFCIPNFIYTDIRIYPKYPKYPNLSKNIQKYPKISKNIQKYPKNIQIYPKWIFLDNIPCMLLDK